MATNATEVAALFDEKGKAWEAFKEVQGRAAAENRDLNADEKAIEERTNTRLSEIDKEIRTYLEEAEKAERADADNELRSRFDAIQEKATTNKGDKEIAGEYRALDTWVKGEGSASLYLLGEGDRYVDRMFSARALNTTDDDDVIPTTLFGELVRQLRESSPILSSGVRIIRTSGGEEIQIPVLSTYNDTNGPIAELAQFTQTEPGFTQRVLNAYKYGHLTQVSNEFLTDSLFNIASLVAELGGDAIGRKLDLAVVTGDGTGDPNGLINAVTGATAVATTAVTTDEILDLIYSLLKPYRSRAKFVMNESTILALRKLKYEDGTGATNQYIWQPGLMSTEPDRIFGYPIVEDFNMPDMAADANAIVFGDLSRYWVRLVGGVEVKRSEEFAFDTDAVTWRFKTRADGEFADVNAIKALTMDDGV